MIRRVMEIDTEKWRLVMDKLTTLLTKGCWVMKISSRVDMQDRPRKLTEIKFVLWHSWDICFVSPPSHPAIL